MGEYNGWTNYETWNVALWLGNDEGWTNHIGESTRIYSDTEWVDATVRIMTDILGWKRENPEDVWEISYETPDGVEYLPWFCTARKRIHHPKVNWLEIYETFKSDWAEEDEDE